MKKGSLSSPFKNPHPIPSIHGDRRDIHDHNPAIPTPRDRAKSDPENDFVDGVNGQHYIGPVDVVADDCVASPMMGQRRSANGQYESVKRRDQV